MKEKKECEYCKNVRQGFFGFAEPVASTGVSVKLSHHVYDNIPMLLHLDLMIDENANLALWSRIGKCDIGWFKQPIYYCPMCGEQLVELEGEK